MSISKANPAAGEPASLVRHNSDLASDSASDSASASASAPRARRSSIPRFVVPRWLEVLDDLELRLRRRLPGGEPASSGGEANNAGRLQPGSVVKQRYRVESLIGRGGMGRVWRAIDPVRNRVVAVKELTARSQSTFDDFDDFSAKQRLASFSREFYTMSKLRHPSIVEVFDYGLLGGGSRFIVMELVPGQELRTLARGKKVPLSQAFSLVEQLVRALGFIHSRLYVHCDIKSANIRVRPDGSIKLLDFGLLHQLGTPTGDNIKGTPQYMAPEVIRGGVIDGRTDLYSVGVLAYELTYGEMPFGGTSLYEVLGKHCNARPPRLGSDPNIPRPWAEILLRLLRKDPADRFADASALLRALCPLTGSAVEQIDSRTTTSYLRTAELVGRTNEERRLSTLLGAVQEQRGHPLFVSGAAGVGKTRLLQEFRLSAKLAGVETIVTRCHPEASALAPIGELAARLSLLSSNEIRARYAPRLAGLFPGLLGGSSPARSGSMLQYQQSLTQWAREFADQLRFILFVEDLHWADAGTIDMLNALLRALHGTGGAVIGTFRGDEVDRLSGLFETVDDGLTEVMTLEPLSADHTHELVCATMGTRQGQEQWPTLLERIHEVTAGNAFFITELLRVLIEEGAFCIVGAQWVLQTAPARLELPQTIADAVSRRVRTLRGDAAALCRRLAPLGRVLPMGLVRELAEGSDEDLFSLLDELVERQFLNEGGATMTFAHDTVWQSIADTMGAEDLAHAHMAVARALDRSERERKDAARLAYHFERGGDHTRAVACYRRAGDDADRRHMNRQAAEHYARAADLVEAEGADGREKTLFELWRRAIDAGYTGYPGLAVRYTQKLHALWERYLGQDPALLSADYYAKISRLRTRRGPLTRWKLKRAWRDRTIEISERDPLRIVPQMAIYRSMQGTVYASEGKLAELAKVSDLVRRHHAEGPLLAAGLLGEIGANLHLGKWRDLEKFSRDACGWYEDHLARVGVMPRYLWKAYVFTQHFAVIGQAMSGRPLDEQILESGLELSERFDFPDLAWLLESNRAIRAAVLADPEPMKASYDALVTALRKLGSPRMLARLLPAWVGMYWIQRREREQSEAVCTQLEGWRNKHPGNLWMQLYATAFRGFYEAEFGEPEAATRALDTALDASGHHGFRFRAQLLCASARHQHRLGQLDQAQALARQALEMSRDPATASPWDELVALRTLAQALGPDGIDVAREQIDAARRYQMPFHEGLGQLCLASAQEDAGSDPSAATTSRRQGEAILQKLRCTEWLRRAAQ
ncbi:MAG: protein kinase [Myxococcota bacterium]